MAGPRVRSPACVTNQVTAQYRLRLPVGDRGEIYTNDRRLRDGLKSEEACRKRFGAEMTRKLRLRIAALRAAESLADLWPRKSGPAPKTIGEICSGKALISPTTAQALEEVFQRPAHCWPNLQRCCDAAMALVALVFIPRGAASAPVVHYLWAGPRIPVPYYIIQAVPASRTP